MKKLKLESLGYVFWIILLLALFAGLFFAGSNVFATEPEATPLYDVPRDELEGTYVTVNLDYIYGCYAYTETYEDNKPTGKITEREYLIDANEYDFMCIVLGGDLMEQAEVLLEQSDEYYYGERDTITADFRVSGYVKPLPSDSIRLLKEAVDFSSMTPEEQDTYLMLYIDPADYTTDPILLTLGLVCVAVILIFVVLALSGYYQKDVRERLLQYFGASTERAEEFLNYLVNLPKAGGLRIGAGYLLVQTGGKHRILDGNDLLWAYHQTTTTRYMGLIPVGKSHAVMLKLVNGKQIQVPMSKNKVAEQLQILLQQFPTVAIGYSDQLLRIYNSNPADLRHVAAAQRSPQQ